MRLLWKLLFLLAVAVALVVYTNHIAEEESIFLQTVEGIYLAARETSVLDDMVSNLQHAEALHGQRCLVTGGNGGLGKGISTLLHTLGCDVVVATRSTHTPVPLSSTENATLVPLDLADFASICASVNLQASSKTDCRARSTTERYSSKGHHAQDVGFGNKVARGDSSSSSSSSSDQQQQTREHQPNQQAEEQGKKQPAQKGGKGHKGRAHDERTAEHCRAASSAPFDVVVLNAGVAPYQNNPTKQGFEQALGTNCIGNMLFALGLYDAHLLAPDARLVIVVSETHRAVPPLDFAHLLDPINYTLSESMAFYARSKLCLVTAAQILAERFSTQNIAVHTICPGPVHTNIARDAPEAVKGLVELFMKTAFQTPEGAARPVVTIATTPAFAGPSGSHHHMYKLKPPRADTLDEGKQEQLWQVLTTAMRNNNATCALQSLASPTP